MMPRIRIPALLAAMAVSTLTLAPLGVSAVAPAAPAAATVHVTIKGFAFNPATITVAPGTTVVWTQQDSAPHTVTSDTNAWTASNPLSTGQTFSHVFTTPGTYAYHCSIHPYMTAKVIVASGGSTGTALVKTASAQILVSAPGRTLYVFSHDRPNKIACTGDCIKFWPPLLVPAGTKVPATMAGVSGKFDVASRAGGSKQLTFDGAPLYTFANDAKAGDMNGQGVISSWWTVVAPSSGHGGSAAATGAGLVKTAPARLLVTAHGKTLYVFAMDKPNKSLCAGGCAKFWPPLLVPAGMSVPATMAGLSGKFGVTSRAGGGRQLTIDGAPLYTFANDAKAGDIAGQGFVGLWWAVTA